MYISTLLKEKFWIELVDLPVKYKDSFVQDYHEIIRLDKDLIEHYLPIKPNFRSFIKPNEKRS